LNLEFWSLNIVCPPAKAIASAIAGREFGIWDLEFIYIDYVNHINL
jgi:hypothetical protein